MSEIDDFMASLHGWIARADKRLATELTRQYSRGYSKIRKAVDALEVEFRAMIARGDTPSIGWFYTSQRARALMQEIRAQLERYVLISQREIEDEMRRAIVKALEPPLSGVGWRALSLKDVEIMTGLGMPGSPLRTLLRSISEQGWRDAMDALVEGLMLGQSPRKVARRLRDVLGVQLDRALTIARTEMLRVMRLASRESYRNNEHVLDGWIWHATLDERTCFACVMMHGTLHPLDEVLESHPNCRCAMAPLTKDWDELGIKGMPKRPNIKTGEEWFRALSAKRQRAIMGKAKRLAWQDGHFDLSDVLRQTHHSAWGRGIGTKSLRDLVGEDLRREYLAKTRS